MENPAPRKWKLHISGSVLERSQRKRTLAIGVRGGFYFHPSDIDLSPRTPDRKKPLDIVLPVYSYSGFSVTEPPLADLNERKQNPFDYSPIPLCRCMVIRRADQETARSIHLRHGAV